MDMIIIKMSPSASNVLQILQFLSRWFISNETPYNTVTSTSRNLTMLLSISTCSTSSTTSCTSLSRKCIQDKLHILGFIPQVFHFIENVLQAYFSLTRALGELLDNSLRKHQDDVTDQFKTEGCITVFGMFFTKVEDTFQETLNLQKPSDLFAVSTF